LLLITYVISSTLLNLSASVSSKNVAGKGWAWWLMPVIYWKVDTENITVQGQLGEELARLHLHKQARCGGRHYTGRHR
jgi:hypothetical protein